MGALGNTIKDNTLEYFQICVENKGKDKVTGPFKVKVSTYDVNGDLEEAKLFEVKGMEFVPGETCKDVGTLFPEIGFDPKREDILVKVELDVEDVIKEIDETNNVKEMSLSKKIIPAGITCTDSDKGDLTIKGTVLLSDGTMEVESCYDSSVVRELSCSADGQKVVASLTSCPSGMQCADGACIVPETDPITINVYQKSDVALTQSVQSVSKASEYKIKVSVKPDKADLSSHVLIATVTYGGVQKAKISEYKPSLAFGKSETIEFTHAVDASASGEFKVAVMVWNGFLSDGFDFKELVPAKVKSYGIN
jgi:hypothetical protein